MGLLGLWPWPFSSVCINLPVICKGMSWALWFCHVSAMVFAHAMLAAREKSVSASFLKASVLLKLGFSVFRFCLRLGSAEISCARSTAVKKNCFCFSQLFEPTSNPNKSRKKFSSAVFSSKRRTR